MSNNTPTIGDLMKFILANRADKVFIGCSEADILQEIWWCLEHNSLYYNTVDGSITGVILAEPREDTKTLFVTRNLAMSLEVLKKFAEKAKEQFKGYKLEWLKRDILKQHNTDKIYQKLAI